MKEILSRYCIPQLFTTIKTTVTNAAQVKIGTRMPTQIGLIYGLSLTVAGYDDGNNALITYANTQALYLILQKGSTNAIDAMRLDKLVYTNAGLNTILPATDKRYLEAILPNTLSLDQSYYANPTAITSGEIMLDLWYLSNEMVSYLIDKGAIDMRGILLTNT